MQFDSDFWVVQNTQDGRILKETKASGNPRPALYPSEAAARRAMGQRGETHFMMVDNPDYDPTIDRDEIYRMKIDWQKRQELLGKTYKQKRVAATPGIWQIVKVKLQAV